MKLTKWLVGSALAVCVGIALPPAGMAEDEPIPEANPYSGDKRKIRSGRSWYRNVCSNCHGGRADGQGERGTGADLRKFKKGFHRYIRRPGYPGCRRVFELCLDTLGGQERPTRTHARHPA